MEGEVVTIICYLGKKRERHVRCAPSVHMHKLGIGNDEEIMGKIRL